MRRPSQVTAARHAVSATPAHGPSVLSHVHAFYVGETRQGSQGSQVSWLSEKYADLAALPGLRRERWQASWLGEPLLEELRGLDRLSWVLLHLLGLSCLVRRRRLDRLLLLYLPLLTMIAVNILGRWPLGAFRTNLFLCLYVFPIPVYGLTQLAGAARWRQATVAAAVMLFYVLPGFAFGFDWHREKATWTKNHRMPRVLELLRERRQLYLRHNPKLPRAWLILDSHTAQSYKYYVSMHPSSRQRNREYFEENFRWRSELLHREKIEHQLKRYLRKTKHPIWVVISKRQYVDRMYRYASRVGRIVFQRRVGHDHLVLRVARK
jgi:hypothetical protein